MSSEGDNRVGEDAEVDGADYTDQNNKKGDRSKRNFKIGFGFFHIHEDNDL